MRYVADADGSMILELLLELNVELGGIRLHRLQRGGGTNSKIVREEQTHTILVMSCHAKCIMEEKGWREVMTHMRLASRDAACAVEDGRGVPPSSQRVREAKYLLRDAMATLPMCGGWSRVSWYCARRSESVRLLLSS